MRQNDDFVAQLVEQLTLNQWAEGSSPSEVTENKLPTFVGGFLFMLVFLLFKQVVLTNNHVPERFRKRPNYNDDSSQIVFPKVCKSQFYYFCNGNFKNDKLWNLHMNKSRK